MREVGSSQNTPEESGPGSLFLTESPECQKVTKVRFNPQPASRSAVFPRCLSCSARARSGFPALKNSSDPLRLPADGNTRDSK